MLELLTGLLVQYENTPDLPFLVEDHIRENEEDSIITLLDKNGGEIHSSIAISLFKLAIHCTQHRGYMRPSIHEIQQLLQNIEEEINF
jgi:hypothetical protein